MSLTVIILVIILYKLFGLESKKKEGNHSTNISNSLIPNSELFNHIHHTPFYALQCHIFVQIHNMVEYQSFYPLQ